MEPWLDNLITIAITAIVSAITVYFTYKTQQKAQKTQQVQNETEKQFGLTDRWQIWAQEQVDAREKMVVELDKVKKQAEASKQDIVKLANELEKFRGWIDGLVNYILELLEWAKDAKHATPYPPIPYRIAHLITKEKKNE